MLVKNCEEDLLNSHFTDLKGMLICYNNTVEKTATFTKELEKEVKKFLELVEQKNAYEMRCSLRR